MSEITVLQSAAARHEGFASEELLPLVYDELRRPAMASGIKVMSPMQWKGVKSRPGDSSGRMRE